jgi:hypothetical protein
MTPSLSMMHETALANNSSEHNNSASIMPHLANSFYISQHRQTVVSAIISILPHPKRE